MSAEKCTECGCMKDVKTKCKLCALISGGTRNVFHCAARGCDGCTICKPKIKAK